MRHLERHKAAASSYVDSNDESLLAISHAIHSNPELGLQEHRACELLVSTLRDSGFEVQTPVAGLETAFVAEYESGRPGPRVGFVAEYDCVPGLGHACGHNIIAASAVGAALALQSVLHETGGSIKVFGTPDEEAVSPESRGGKVIMAESGVFDEVDVVLMTHPHSGDNVVWDYTFPLKDFNVTFIGKPAHYTLPHEGVNALECLLSFLNAVKAMQSNWRSGVMFAFTIVDGGGASPIVIPEKATAHVAMKAFDAGYLEEVFSKVEQCVSNVADTMGAKAVVNINSEYKNTIPNLALVSLVEENLRLLGLPTRSAADSQRALAGLAYPGPSTDFADVSWVVPGVHWWSSVGDKPFALHTPEFARAAGSAEGDQTVLMASRAMAMTGVDLLTTVGCVERIIEEFRSYKKCGFRNVPGIPPDFKPVPGDH
ncbi:MAG: amidohydrolase [Lysobacterales bacterium]|jgi:amidohydrolase